MRILLSNDDGITAPGLGALRAAVEDLGSVTVVAPDSPQSAAGHAITVHSPLVVKRVEVPGGKAFTGMSVAGRPADCVRLAIRSLLEEPPEVVLAGINEGANVGINVFYSGTVAAAAEAALCGFPAVAFSATEPGGTIDYPQAARLCRWVLDKLLAGGLVRGDLINVNIPSLAKGPPKGARFVPQSTAGLEDTYQPGLDAAGQRQYQLGANYRFARQDSDVACLNDGYITVTPLHVDMTNHDRLAAMSVEDWGDPIKGNRH